MRHLIERVPLRIERKVVGKRIDARFAATKEQLRDGDVQRVRVVADDTVRTLEHVARGSCDAIVADLPYGVRHGSKTSGAGLRRGPAELLDDALAVWRDALAPGGAIGLSWNTMVLPRDGVVCRLEGAGFTVLAGGAWDGFAHRVDQAIVRDLVVARPTAEPASGREAGLRPSQPERA